MCGFPPGCTSPAERSSRAGTSSFCTKSAASKYPGVPGWIFALPDWRSRIGNHPVSSSAPVQTTRSALRAAAIRLGLAWMTCGSWRAVVAEYTVALSPASSCVSAAHSGSHASTFSAALAGCTAAEPRRSDEHHRELSAVHLNVLRRRISETCEWQSIGSCGMFRSHAHHARPGSSGTGRTPGCRWRPADCDRSPAATGCG